MIARVSTGFFQGIVLALSLSLSASALAWNAAGHRLVASIAWDHLRPEVREEAARLLRAHPEYARWLKRGEGENPDRIAFIEYIGEKQTYDLEIAETHNFIANDILVHNSHAAR